MEPEGNERIAMPPKIVHAALTNQDSSLRLWRDSGEFAHVKPMNDKAESAESTAAVARRLRLTREAFEMKKATWCRLVGITPQAWSNVEGTAGTPALNRIALDQALLVCRATGVDLDWIYRGSRDRLPHKLLMKINELETADRRKAG